MTDTLATLTLALARAIATVKSGAATGGSTTTLVDTGFYNPEVDDYWNNGAIWFQSGNNAGKSAIITDWANSSKTFTFATQAGACAAGNLYSVTHRDFPRWLLRQAVNRALQEIGGVGASNTTLTTVGGQEEYSLPASVNHVLRVEVARSTSTPYDYQPHHNWKVIGDKLRFDPSHIPCDAGLIIRLTYSELAVSELTADTDTVNELIHPDLVVWKAAVFALAWRVQNVREARPDMVALLGAAERAAARAEALYLPIVSASKRPTIQASTW